MGDDKLLRQVFPAFAEVLGKLQFQIVQKHYAREHFGNAEIVLSTAKLRVRISRDRGDVTVDVGLPDRENWYHLEDVLDFLGGKKLGQRVALVDVEQLAATFLSNYSSIQTLLHDSRRAPELDIAVAIKESEFLAKLSRSNPLH